MIYRKTFTDFNEALGYIDNQFMQFPAGIYETAAKIYHLDGWVVKIDRLSK